MTGEKIEPALSAEEWERKSVRMAPPERDASDWDVALALHSESALVWEYVSEHCKREIHLRPLPAVIALANAALPDSDPRKITRGKIQALRVVWAASVAPLGLNRPSLLRHGGEDHNITEFLDALESYLQPEGT